MAKPSDSEYKLMRKIKDLETQLKNKEERLLQLQKKLEKLENPPEAKPVKKAPVVNNGCPDCGAVIKDTALPFGKLQICSAACGFRKVTRS